MYYKEFKNLHEIYEEKRVGDFGITIHEAVEPDIYTKISNPEMAGQKEQKIVVLRDYAEQDIIMSDSWMEQATNIEFVRDAKGDVLIAGLGLGLIVLAIQDKPEVTSVTVVELSQGIVDLVMPTLTHHLNDKVKVVVSDIHDFTPEKKYNTVYHDIWNDISDDNYEEMVDLKDQFGGECWRWYSTEAMFEGDGYSEEDYCEN